MNAQTGLPSVDKPWMNYYPGVEYSPTAFDKTLYQFLWDANKDRLDLTAINYYGRTINYREFFENTTRLAGALHVHGIKEHDIVTIVSLGTPETVYLLYALNYLGAVANMVSAETPQQALLENIKKTDAKLLFVLDRIFQKWTISEWPIPVIELTIQNSMKGIKKAFLDCTSGTAKRAYRDFISASGTIPQPAQSADQPAIIVYTSGTTGKPKGAVLSSKNLNAVAYLCSRTGKNYQPGQQFLNIIPPFLSFGLGMLHLCLYTGMVDVPSLSVKIPTLQKMLKKYRPERFVLGPIISDVIEHYPYKDLSFLIDLTSGGGAISLDKERALNAVLTAKHAQTGFLTGYGMTELSSAVSMNHNGKIKEQSIGIPLPGVNVKVVDVTSGEELGYGMEGELLINSPSTMTGYYQETGETEKVLFTDSNGDRWLHTGDIAKIDEDGFLYITGRLKRIYVVRNQSGMISKVFPQRLEELIEKCSAVNRCGVVVLPDDAGENRIYAFVSAQEKTDPAALKERIEAMIHEQLPDYYRPAAIQIIDAIPCTLNQKIDYRKLESMLH